MRDRWRAGADIGVGMASTLPVTGSQTEHARRAIQVCVASPGRAGRGPGERRRNDRVSGHVRSGWRMARRWRSATTADRRRPLCCRCPDGLARQTHPPGCEEGSIRKGGAQVAEKPTVAMNAVAASTSGRGTESPWSKPPAVPVDHQNRRALAASAYSIRAVPRLDHGARLVAQDGRNGGVRSSHRPRPRSRCQEHVAPPIAPKAPQEACARQAIHPHHAPCDRTAREAAPKPGRRIDRTQVTSPDKTSMYSAVVRHVVERDFGEDRHSCRQVTLPNPPPVRATKCMSCSTTMTEWVRAISVSRLAVPSGPRHQVMPARASSREEFRVLRESMPKSLSHCLWQWLRLAARSLRRGARESALSTSSMRLAGLRVSRPEQIRKDGAGHPSRPSHQECCLSTVWLRKSVGLLPIFIGRCPLMAMSALVMLR